MENYIQELNADLAETERLMRSFLPTTSGFEELLSLYLLYRKHNHTDAIIEYAEAVIKSGEGMDKLLADAKELERRVTGCQRLYVENRETFDSIDNDALFKAHIRPYREAEQAEMEIATRLWREYSDLSNRLDYLAIDSDEYKDMDEKCDAVKAEYDLHHAKVNGLHEALDNETRRCSAALTFTLEDLSLVFHYMQGISRSIIDTVTGQKGGQAWKS